MVFFIEKAAQALQKRPHPHHLHDNIEAANKLAPVDSAKDSFKLQNIDSSALLPHDGNNVSRVDTSTE